MSKPEDLGEESSSIGQKAQALVGLILVKGNVCCGGGGGGVYWKVLVRIGFKLCNVFLSLRKTIGKIDTILLDIKSI